MCFKAGQLDQKRSDNPESVITKTWNQLLLPLINLRTTSPPKPRTVQPRGFFWHGFGNIVIGTAKFQKKTCRLPVHTKRTALVFPLPGSFKLLISFVSHVFSSADSKQSIRHRQSWFGRGSSLISTSSSFIMIKLSSLLSKSRLRASANCSLQEEFVKKFFDTTATFFRDMVTQFFMLSSNATPGAKLLQTTQFKPCFPRVGRSLSVIHCESTLLNMRNASYEKGSAETKEKPNKVNC